MNHQEVTDMIRRATVEQLLDRAWLCDAVERSGARVFGYWPGIRLLQIPEELSNCLLHLTQFMADIRSYLEIGIMHGGTLLFVTEYLRRFNPELKAYGLDPNITASKEAAEMIGATVIKGGTADMFVQDWLAQTKPDLIFVDGDHKYAGVYRDFMQVRDYCKILMFHDIHLKKACPDVVRCWKREIWPWALRAGHEVIEFASTQGVGIGLIRKRVRNAEDQGQEPLARPHRTGPGELL